MTFENAKVAEIGKGVFCKLKSAILFCCHQTQTIANMKFCIYISEEVSYVVNTS